MTAGENFPKPELPICQGLPALSVFSTSIHCSQTVSSPLYWLSLRYRFELEMEMEEEEQRLIKEIVLLYKSLALTKI